MDIWSLSLQIIPILLLFFWFIRKKQSYWSERGVAGPKPRWLLGNTLDKFLNTPELEKRWLKQYGRIYGVYNGLFSPVLSISDADAIKQVLVKDFNNFVDRGVVNYHHETMNDTLFLLDGEKWKSVRSITTPAFTSGKLRAMQSMMNECVDRLINRLNKITTEGPKVFPVKQTAVQFTVEVIGTTNFAIDTSGGDDYDEKMTPILRNATKIINVSAFQLVAMYAFPLWLNNLVGVHHDLNHEASEYFFDLCRQIVKQRRANPSFRRNDIVQILLESSVSLEDIEKSGYDKLAASAEKEKPENTLNNSAKNITKSMRKLTDNEIVAQLFLFLVAGYETTANAISFAMHEMAINEQCQERLLEEVRAATADIDNETSEEFFEVVTTKIPYLDAVMKETLRKYPAVTRLERRAAKDGIKVGGIELHKDQLVEISTYATHMDPEYYPDPERWDPERFMPENKHRLVPYTFIPFGDGPRNCVGMRFAAQEIKLCLSRLITKFRFRRAPTTKEPVQLTDGSLMISPVSLDLIVERR